MTTEVSIQSNSVEFMCNARVITDAQGTAQTIILTGPYGVEMKLPGGAFPFVLNGHNVLAVLSLVQVSEREPSLAPKLLIPGKPS
jgi:hypothetical protein